MEKLAIMVGSMNKRYAYVAVGDVMQTVSLDEYGLIKDEVSRICKTERNSQTRNNYCKLLKMINDYQIKTYKEDRKKFLRQKRY